MCIRYVFLFMLFHFLHRLNEAKTLWLNAQIHPQKKQKNPNVVFKMISVLILCWIKFAVSDAYEEELLCCRSLAEHKMVITAGKIIIAYMRYIYGVNYTTVLTGLISDISKGMYVRYFFYNFGILLKFKVFLWCAR